MADIPVNVAVIPAMAPHRPHRVIGIRPGEKLHEVMCPSDDSHSTLEFTDHLVIKPTVKFAAPINFEINNLGEKGRAVHQGFKYHSGRNSHFLEAEGIVAFNHLAGV